MRKANSYGWLEETHFRLKEGGTKIIKRPVIDPKLCVDCGICENKCPVHDRSAVRVSSIGERRSPSNKMILTP